MEPDPKDVDALVREKYAGDRAAAASDIERLCAGEPLAYVIGHMPFLGLSVHLDSKPLIPRPETEWWTEVLVGLIGERRLKVLDLCAGSGAIGLAILKYCTNAYVSFGELVPRHTATIRKNIERNGLDAARSDVRVSNLFGAYTSERFDAIVTNPPYLPTTRELPESVSAFEPKEALYAGADGLSLIRRIAKEAKTYLNPNGLLFMECDIENIEEAKRLILEGGATRAEIRNDQYGRPRLVVAFY